MLKHKILIIILLIVTKETIYAQQAPSERPGIGLVLSGGGAKGLSHIGILKAIDAAGLKIDYIAGTSMGSIVGAMYASGYPADSIEKIARNIDWDLLLSNQSLLRSYIMEEKPEYNRYALEIPLSNGRLKFSSGLLEGEELWLKFSEIFFPIYGVTDFKQLPIPFLCIATDLTTGKAVVLDSGNLVTALRSSMAIPSVFTAVDRDGKKLVDGGLIRNFPASDVKKMGASIIIGSDVASGLKDASLLNSPIDVLLQIAFFKEAALKPFEDSLCNIYIKHPLDSYNSGSFNNGNAIIDTGILLGNAYYPYFKKLADSLNAIYGTTLPVNRNFLTIRSQNIIIDSIIISGLKKTDEHFLKKMMGLETNKIITEKVISTKIRNAFGTRYYNKIIYQLEPLPNGHAKLLLEVTENPLSFVKFGLHYNGTTGVNAIINLTTRNWLFKRSRDLVSVNLGDNFRIKAEHMQLIGKGSGKYAMFLEGYAEKQDQLFYNDFEADGMYILRYSYVGGRIQSSRNRSLTTGIGTRYEWTSFKPEISAATSLDGKNRNGYIYTYFHLNTLNKPYLPVSGIKINTELGWIYGQEPQGSLKSINGVQIPFPTRGLEFGNYSKFIFSFEGYRTLKHKNTFFQMLQCGILFNNTQTIFNDFFVGGLNNVIRNQAVFAGLKEGAVVTPSYLSYLWGWRKMWTTNGYTSLRANVMAYDFIEQKNKFEAPNWLIGYSATVGYNSPIGPLEFSFMYAHQTNKLATYINLGFPF